jgi:pimeloyl-ACP methyl ester carboxylesterase
MSIRRPEGFQHFEQQVPGVKLHYVREGSGPPLVLLHGWPGFWWEWHKVIGPLAEGFDVIVPDLRGYGDSEKPDPSDSSLYSLEHAIDDIDALLEALEIDTAYVVGHDWSALLMHKFVRKYRHRVIRAMTFDPITPDFGPFYLGFPHMSESWYSQFQQLDMAVELVSSSREACAIYFRHFLDHWAHEAPLLSSEEMEIYVDTFMKEGNVLGGFNWYRANLSVTSAPFNQLDQTVSDVPITFLWGMGDPVVPSTTSTDIPKYYNNYTLEYVPDGGHYMMVEKPELVIDRIRRDFR